MKTTQNKSFLSTNDMLANKGYHTVTPKVGGLGYALMQASKENPNEKWLKHHLDGFFRGLRKERRSKKRNEH